MVKPVLRTVLFFAALSVGYILLDLVLNFLSDNTGEINVIHIGSAVIVVMISYLLLSRAVEARRRSEATLRQARDELEIRVQERTAELEQANQLLEKEITERQQAEQKRDQSEQALRISEEKFAGVFHASPDAIGVIRLADNALLDMNEAFTELFGYGYEETIGKKWTELNLFPFGDEPTKIAHVFNVGGELADYELDLLTHSGDRISTLLSLASITINGEACILAVAHDITQRKRSEEALQEVQAELALDIQKRSALKERQRLARELHDSVSQALYSISLGTHTALTWFDTDREKVLEALNYVLTLAQAGLTEMRALIFELRPESLEMEGLVTALTKQTADLQARYGIEVDLSLCDEPDTSLAVKEVLYRIAQEAFQNAVKHARSTHLDVRLKQDAGDLWLEVCDNGVGFDTLAVFPGHLGLRSMQERARSVGGELEIASALGCGTEINAHIPLDESVNAKVAV